MCLVYEIPHKRWTYLKNYFSFTQTSTQFVTRRGPVRGGVGSRDSFNFQPQRPRGPTSTVLLFNIFAVACFLILQYCPCTISQMTDFSYLGCIVSCVATCWIRIYASINLWGLLYIFSCFGLKELLSTHWMFCPTACPQLLIELSIWLEGHQH